MKAFRHHAGFTGLLRLAQDNAPKSTVPIKSINEQLVSDVI